MKISDTCEKLLPFWFLTVLMLTGFTGHCPYYLGNFDCRAITSCKSTADEADFLQRGSCINFDHGHLIHHCVLGEGAGVNEVVDWLPPTGEPAGAILQGPPGIFYTDQWNTQTHKGHETGANRCATL